MTDLFRDKPDRHPARIRTIGRQPLAVYWTGEPVWVRLHWLADSGRCGRSMPCTGEDCRIHTTPVNWRAYAPAVEIGPEPGRAAPAAGGLLERFAAMSPEAREPYLQRARERYPHTRDQMVWFSAAAQIAAAHMPAEAQTSAPQARGRAVVIDMPSGCAGYLADQFCGPWRGRGCRLRRPNTTGAPTIVDMLTPPAGELPEPAPVKAILCQLWGYQLERVAEAQDNRDRNVLQFAQRA